ncbi:type II toxin-antitoxin system RelB/DinJ family antitoxin [Paratractidigestivibacter sp.]|uniref:type II toxin-antitoxin system RelB/DinJ family antitoxin n=1 Tax=Paratractidigestivibacter sp. TaxID=2847316 RepID=UPI002ABE527E|nr:type II toxin-antitoxin system RelB/DinJ family antitoxin [Paratractidigestivibacter sp.]
MEKTATLNLRVSPEVKSSAEYVLDQLGIPMSTAITMYLKQIALTGGIPFTPRIPSAPRAVDADRMSDDELRSLISSRITDSVSGNLTSLADARHPGEAY